jgi:hypothetical protein
MPSIDPDVERCSLGDLHVLSLFGRERTTGVGMDILIRALITFVVVLLVLYLVNMLPIDGRTKRIVRIIVIIIGLLSLLSYLVNF